jgi:hypothetical protein
MLCVRFIRRFFWFRSSKAKIFNLHRMVLARCWRVVLLLRFFFRVDPPSTAAAGHG